MYRYFVLFLFSFSALSFCLFADDEQIGCNTCQSCWDQILNCATNGNGNCSCTNCVQFTPEECTNHVATVSQSLTNIYQMLDYAETDLLNIRQEVFYISQNSVFASNLLVQAQSVINNLQDTNSCVQLIQQAISRLDSLSHYVLPVEENVIGRTNLIYTNLLTGVSKPFSSTTAVGNRLKVVTNYLHQAITAHNNYAGDVTSAQVDLTRYLDQSLQLLGDICDLSSQLLDQTKVYDEYYFPVIRSSANDISASLETVNCASCSEGSGGGGGSSGGGGSTGGTIDFTPIEQALRDLQSELTYQLNRLYNLLQRYYDDYKNAANSPSGGYTSQSYNASKNWFSRVEMLLYPMGSSSLPVDYENARFVPQYGPDYYGKGESQHNWFVRVEQLLAMIADPSKIGHDTVGDDGPTEPPEKLEDTTRVKTLESSSSSGETNAENQKGSIESTLNNGWQRVSAAFSRFANSLSNIGVHEQNIDGMSLELTIGTDDTNMKDPFIIPTGTSQRLGMVRSGFRIFWLLLCAFLYIYAFKLFFSLIFAYISWFMKLASATFGS